MIIQIQCGARANSRGFAGRMAGAGGPAVFLFERNPSFYTPRMFPLESCKLFAALPPNELRDLKGVTQEITFGGGTEIFKEGDAGDALYVVKDGAVQISVLVPGGERQVFSRLIPGDVFGEMAVIDDEPRSASAVAEVDTVVFCVPREAMLTMLRKSPQLWFNVTRQVTRRLREFNQQYMQRVIQAERMALVGRFANSIVHDLKNPLTIISVAADLACQRGATDDARHVAQARIRKQVDRITDMVSDILEYTRGAGARPATTLTSYAAFVQPVIDDIAREVARKNVAVQFVNAPPAISVRLNARRLSRVFYNLLFNAVDEMPDGGNINLRFQVTPSELVTEIEDSGKGIAPEVLDKLFEAFATFGKSHGTGLGLSIARKIVDEHGGRIYARNVPGSGALFGFTLPLAPGS